MMRRAALVLILLLPTPVALAQTAVALPPNLIILRAPKGDALVAPAPPAGTRVTATPVDGALGWLRLAGPDGAVIGYAREGDMGGRASRPSALEAFLTGGQSAPVPAAPMETAAAPAPPAVDQSPLLAYLGVGSAGGKAAPARGGGNAAAPLTLAALTDGRLEQAQAAYAEEQRRLAEIAAAEQRAADAEWAARQAEDRAMREEERIEREMQRAEERRRQQAGDAIIGNAIANAALSIGNAMADNVRADFARREAESQRRMADANRRAAEQQLINARADAERARREAAALRARAQSSTAAAQPRAASVDYTAWAQAQRAAEAQFRQQQANVEQARRTQAQIAQQQSAMMANSARQGFGGSSSPQGSQPSYAASASPPPASAGASASRAPSVVSLDINYHDVGNGSGSRQVENLQVRVFVERVKVNGDKSYICAEFRNPLAGEWRGGFRLTDRYDTQTFSTLAVGAGQTVKRCEILQVVKTYHVVLRRDDPPRSRDTSFGVRG